MSSPDTRNDAAETPGVQPAEPAAPQSHAATEPPAAGEEEILVDMRSWREVAVEIPADVVSRETDAAVQRYTKLARVPGFRKGKVPASIIRSRFADDIRSEVLEHLVPQYFRDAVIKEGFRPVSEPKLHDLHMEAGTPLRFKAAFEVMPEIELGDYRDIKVEVPQIEVSDADVDKELHALQERQASYDPVDEDRPLGNGDFAQVSFKALSKEAASEPQAEGEKPQQPAQPVQMDEVLIEIGGANTMPEFSENLRGGKAGEDRTFDISYPADYYEPRMAGKTFSYTAKINAIKKKTAPELNDDFARELSQDFQTLDDLKKRIREGIEHERRHNAENEAREKLVDQLMQRHDFPVPETLVRQQIDYRLERGLRALAAQGMRPEDMKRMDFNRLRAGQRDAAIREVKTNMLLAKIAEAENIEISDAELDQEIQLLAQQLKQTPEAVRQQYTQDGTLERIRERMRIGKTMHILLGKAAAHAENGTA